MSPTPPGTRIRDLSQRIRHAWDALSGRAFSPGEPLETSNTEAEPRRFDYSVSRNTIVTPRTEEPEAQLTAFDQLRALCNTYDIASLCIKHLTERAQLVPWSIVAKDPEQQEALQSRCDEVREFFEYPDRLDDWASWLARALNNVLVLDALPIYLRPTRSGGVYALEVVDGATIKPVIDYRGRVLGFQQLVKGLPMSQYQRAGVDAPDERLEGFGDAGRMLYAVRYPRPDGVYGHPPIERVLIAANTALRQQHFQLAHFSEGNIPAGVIEMPASMTAQQVQEFLEDFDAVLKGNAAARSSLVGIPPGGKLNLFKPFQYDTAIPEWLMKTTCAAFGVPPSVLGGYTADVNRATADSQDHQGDQGVRSLLEWFRGRVLNTVIGRELGYPDVELRFLWGDETDRLQQAQTHKIYVEMGALTPEQALRDAYGDTYEYLGGTEPEAPEEDDADTDADEWLKMGAPTLTKADDTPNAWIERAKRFFRRVYGNQFDRVLEAVEEAGDNVQTALATFWATETPRIIRAVLPFYDQVLRTGIEQGAATVNIGVDWDMVNEAVLDLAREEAQTFAERMVTTGQGATAKAIAQWIELGGDMPELIDRVRTTWTGPRPDTAAVTEVTRLYSQGQRRAWENTGVVKEWEWMTAEDEMVCPVCNPLNGKRFPISDTTNLPPAHPNCRCDVAPITMTPEELRNG